ncbi:MAG: exodeoxyribonuclease VII large subunit, partial [Chloroflexota bacterium]|nr:exodeoxyribonuclease VII large subunit [Chloroflexota bacterium]
MRRPRPDEEAPLTFDDLLARGAPTPPTPTGPSGAREGSSRPAAQPGPRILAVGDLTRIVRDTLRDAPRLRDLWVEGEVGQVSV